MNESDYWLPANDRRRSFAKYWLSNCHIPQTSQYWALRAIKTIRQAEENTAVDDISINDAAEIIQQAYEQWLQHAIQHRAQLMIEASRREQEASFVEQLAISLAGNPEFVKHFDSIVGNSTLPSAVAHIAECITHRLRGDSDDSV